jgi:hypothetical protein
VQGGLAQLGYATPLSGLYELDRVRLAQATWDEFQGFRALLDFHLEAGRPVYGWFQPVTWEELDEDGLLSGLRAVPIHEVGWGGLAQIVKVTSAAADIGGTGYALWRSLEGAGAPRAPCGNPIADQTR